MRYALIVSSCLCVAAWLNVAAEAQGPRLNKRSAKQAKQAERVENPDDKIVWPEETIKGWGRNQAEAEEYALQKAQDWVLRFLRQKHPGVTRKAPTSFIRQHLVTGPAKRLPEFDQLMGVAPDAFNAECWGLPVAINPETYRALLRLERENRLEELRAERSARMTERMGILGKLLMAAVALLAAVAGYLRLEDWTKGYYTWWLRAAVIGFLSFVALGLMLVA